MSVKGTVLKINVHVDPIGDIHLSDCDFTCFFFVYTNKGIMMGKDDMIKVDDDNYIAEVDTAVTGAGTIQMRIEIDVPDPDCKNGYRKEVESVCTGVKIRQ